jgi:hypothetical protein
MNDKVLNLKIQLLINRQLFFNNDINKELYEKVEANIISKLNKEEL